MNLRPHRPHRRHRRHRAMARGFTLLELTLAISVAAMLSLTLYTALSTGLRMRKTTDAQINAPRRATIALDLIESDLQSVVRADPNGTYGGSFIGYAQGQPGSENGSLTFCSIGRDRLQDPTAEDPLSEGVRQVQFGLQSDGLPSPSIVRRITRNLHAPTTSEYEDEVLVDGVRSLGFRYFDGSNWSEEWDSSALTDAAALPIAVEITIELDERGPRPQGEANAGHGYRVSRIIPIAVALPASASTDTSTTGGG